jgi:hypothetical protein
MIAEPDSGSKGSELTPKGCTSDRRKIRRRPSVDNPTRAVMLRRHAERERARASHPNT